MLQTEPYGMRVESQEQLKGNDRYEGFAIDLIQELAKMLGFNYTFVIREDKANGEEKNGSWTGMIGNITAGVIYVYKIAFLNTTTRLQNTANKMHFNL